MSLARIAGLFSIALASIIAAGGELNDKLAPPLNHPAIQYYTGALTDPVTQLIAKLESGAAQLRFDGPQGYLRSLLDALKIPIESQIAVFSKTSLQSPRIEPRNPRTIFFNDSVSAAWTNGGFIEIASHDPIRGFVFYTLPQQPGQPSFQRRFDCLSCHLSDDSLGIPGAMARSMFTAPDGSPLLILGGSSAIDHRTPIEERWGGYYVTGSTGLVPNLGNLLVTGETEDHPESAITPSTLKLTSLETKFDTRNYLAPYSDTAALMVFNHQMHMQNLITRVGWEMRAAATPNPALLRESAEEFVDYLLFVDETPLPAPISRDSVFAAKFSSTGPRDSKGRSLRDLDLKTRLARYPCSYMIYSTAFDALPAAAKTAIYERMRQILSGALKEKKYARLTLADRRAVIEILRDTKHDLPPDYIRQP